MKQKNRFVFRAFGGNLPSALGATATTVAALTVPAISARAQVPFQVMRPENGATVRETVKIQMARRALDDANIKYLSISIDGKFKEAIAVLRLPADQKVATSATMEVDAQTVSLLWNTKLPSADTSGRSETANILGVDDGTHSIEIIAQASDGRRLGKQTLSLNVQNRGGLQIPADGLAMNYKFDVGDTSKYRESTVVEFEGDNTSAAPIQAPSVRGYVSPGFGQSRNGGAGGSMGMSMGRGSSGDSGRGVGGGFGSGGPAGPPSGGFGRPGGGYSAASATGPFTVLVQNVRANFERSTEDAEGADLFYLRDKVTDGTMITGTGAADRLESIYSLKSRYRTVLTSGAVKDAGLANAEHPGAYIAMPIPNLGGGRRRIGQTWTTLTPIKLEWATLDKPPLVSATNTLEGLEWQDGYQTARILQTYDGPTDMPIYGGAGVMKGATVKLSQTIWFAYKAGKIIRMESDISVSGTAPASVLAAMVPESGASGAAAASGSASSSIGGFGGFASNGGPGSSGERGAGMGMPPGGGSSGGFGALATPNQEEAKVPAKFHGNTTIQLILPGVNLDN